MDDIDSKEMAYLILEYKFLKKLGLENLTPDELLKQKIFPLEWTDLTIDKKLEVISYAYKNDTNLDIALDSYREKKDYNDIK